MFVKMGEAKMSSINLRMPKLFREKMPNCVQFIGNNVFLPLTRKINIFATIVDQELIFAVVIDTN